ncbi:MAG: hypothetical protein M5U07_09700 [Xanthobacteraceae bacterium]|nr:hypothetical protein [Xanthobacteraceae bacterium]
MLHDKARPRAPATLHPAIPRVMCPECGRIMRLTRIDPLAAPPRRAEIVTFRCECRFDLRQTLDRVD